MRNELNELRARIEEQTTYNVDYKTEHPDSGDNYAELVPDGTQYNNGASRLSKYMQAHGIEGDAEQVLDQLLFAGFEMESASIFGLSRAAYTGEEYNTDELERFVLDSYPIQEIEAQIDCRGEKFLNGKFQKLDSEQEFCLRLIGGTIYSYEATDCVWFAYVTLENIKEAAQELAE